jgi:hypothetical protein
MSKANFDGIDFGMVDINGQTIYENDVVLWRSDGESVVCHVKWNPYSFSFSLRELNGVDSMCEITNIRRQGEYVRIGNDSEYPGLVERWSKIGRNKMSFMKQGEPGICFPLAAINSCAGAGIEKAFMNYPLLNKMVESGECRKWGGCVNERDALNTIQKEIDVEFVLAESLDDVLENGGILTLINSGGLRACAVVMIEGYPYLVNSDIGEGEFIRPLMSVDELPRSEDPDFHRDYFLLRN